MTVLRRAGRASLPDSREPLRTVFRQPGRTGLHPWRVRSPHIYNVDGRSWKKGNSMAVRGSGGPLLCVGLLLAMPALAATTTDRGECAASADKPDVGSTACSRIIDDANVSVAER